MQDNQPPVLVKGLFKSFGQQRVLAGIDLSVALGETVGVLGRSGTGKSVLLKLLVGLQQPDSGSIRIHGREIAGLALEELNETRKKIGFLFQEILFVLGQGRRVSRICPLAGLQPSGSRRSAGTLFELTDDGW